MSSSEDSHTTEYYLATKKSVALTHATTQTDLKNMTPRESQSRNATWHAIPPTGHAQNRQIHSARVWQLGGGGRAGAGTTGESPRSAKNIVELERGDGRKTL